MVYRDYFIPNHFPLHIAYFPVYFLHVPRKGSSVHSFPTYKALYTYPLPCLIGLDLPSYPHSVVLPFHTFPQKSPGSNHEFSFISIILQTYPLKQFHYHIKTFLHPVVVYPHNTPTIGIKHHPFLTHRLP